MKRDKPVQILCPGCKRGYKPYVFTVCPHCGHKVEKQYTPRREKKRTGVRKKSFLRRKRRHGGNKRKNETEG